MIILNLFRATDTDKALKTHVSYEGEEGANLAKR